MLERVWRDPFIPVYWGKNQKGMQAEQELSAQEQAVARGKWLEARDEAAASAIVMQDLGVHKQVTNRLLEPFLWHTVIVSATDWQNFFNLRCHPAAQPEIRIIAEMIRDAMAQSVPKVFHTGWHLPFIDFDEKAYFCLEEAKKISVGRCARVSYLTHDGKRDPQADIDLADSLQKNGHMSPFEHVAEATLSGAYYGNFKGWWQYRKTLPNEAVFQGG